MDRLLWAEVEQFKFFALLVFWAFGVIRLLGFCYDRMGIEGKPAADQGHDLSSCERTVVVPVHKVFLCFLAASIFSFP